MGCNEDNERIIINTCATTALEVNFYCLFFIWCQLDYRQVSHCHIATKKQRNHTTQIISIIHAKFSNKCYALKSNLKLH